MRAVLGVCLMSLACWVRADSFFPIRHVIVNKTKDIMGYHFHFVEDPSCDSSGYLQVGHMKQMNCKSGKIFTSGTYVLDFEQFYFFNQRKLRCSGSKTYRVDKRRKLFILKASNHCQLDVIES